MACALVSNRAELGLLELRTSATELDLINFLTSPLFLCHLTIEVEVGDSGAIKIDDASHAWVYGPGDRRGGS
jgi:hypothetical protein